MKLFVNYLRDNSPLNVMALMIFAMWIIDTIGLHPSLYPGYQWYVWGIIGLAIRGANWETTETDENQNEQTAHYNWT